jgi:hypothetical protein
VPTKRLPIRSGPHGVSRASGGITPKIVGGQAVPNGKYRPDMLTSTQGQKRRAAAIDIHPRWDPDRVPRGLHPPQRPGVGNFILSVTGGVPVNAAQAA